MSMDPKEKFELINQIMNLVNKNLDDNNKIIRDDIKEEIGKEIANIVDRKIDESMSIIINQLNELADDFESNLNKVVNDGELAQESENQQSAVTNSKSKEEQTQKSNREPYDYDITDSDLYKSRSYENKNTLFMNESTADNPFGFTVVTSCANPGYHICYPNEASLKVLINTARLDGDNIRELMIPNMLTETENQIKNMEDHLVPCSLGEYYTALINKDDDGRLMAEYMIFANTDKDGNLLEGPPAMDDSLREAINGNNNNEEINLEDILLNNTANVNSNNNVPQHPYLDSHGNYYNRDTKVSLNKVKGFEEFETENFSRLLSGELKIDEKTGKYVSNNNNSFPTQLGNGLGFDCNVIEMTDKGPIKHNLNNLPDDLKKFLRMLKKFFEENGGNF